VTVVLGVNMITLKIEILKNSISLVKEHNILLYIEGKEIKWDDENIKEFEMSLIDFILQCHIRAKTIETEEV